MSHFFTEDESKKLVHLISHIEKNTVGEIRIHIEDMCDATPYLRAVEVFNKLEMFRTKYSTGILIYISTEDKKIAIIGDKGIHDIVGDHYWQRIIDEIIHKFKTESIFFGIYYGLEAVGAELIKHFPEKHRPENELSNEISYGKI